MIKQTMDAIKRVTYRN